MSKDKTATQWHPLFAALLRPLLQDHYDVQTNVPVGDLPRQADILVVRRTSDQPTPFRGLWRHLTTWNVLEFKGPTVDARLNDLHLLVEIGFGIHRRQNEERRRQRQKSLGPEQTSFWYVVRSLGGRILASLRRRMGQFEEIESGLWRSQVMQHLVFLVSSENFASEPDSVPLHLLVKRSPEQERELAQIVVEQPHFLQWYGSLLSTLHYEAWLEAKEMAGTKRRRLELDFSAVKDDLTPENIEQLIGFIGEERFLEKADPKKVVEKLGIEMILAGISAEDRRKLKELLE